MLRLMLTQDLTTAHAERDEAKQTAQLERILRLALDSQAQSQPAAARGSISSVAAAVAKPPPPPVAAAAAAAAAAATATAGGSVAGLGRRMSVSALTPEQEQQCVAFAACFRKHKLAVLLS